MVEQLREQLRSKEAALDDLVQDSLGDLKAFRDVVEERNSLRIEVEALQSKMTQLENIMGHPVETNAVTPVKQECPHCSSVSAAGTIAGITSGVTALHWAIALIGIAVASVQLIYLTSHC